MSVTGAGAVRGPFGRPRDESLDGAVLAAVRELLAEDGYGALTVHKVTQRSGVHAKTISRRWSTKAEMVAAAILGGDTELYSTERTRLPTGDLRADLRELISRNLAYLAEPATRAALPALLPQIEASERVRALFERRDHEFRDAIGAVLRRAADSGAAPACAAGKEEIVTVILSGATFNISFGPTRERSAGIAEELLETLLALIRQAPAAKLRGPESLRVSPAATSHFKRTVQRVDCDRFSLREGFSSYLTKILRATDRSVGNGQTFSAWAPSPPLTGEPVRACG